MFGKTCFELGIERGQLGILFSLIQNRFGTLSERSRQQLEAMFTVQREQIASSLFRASSLRDLGLE